MNTCIIASPLLVLDIIIFIIVSKGRGLAFQAEKSQRRWAGEWVKWQI